MIYIIFFLFISGILLTYYLTIKHNRKLKEFQTDFQSSSEQLVNSFINEELRALRVATENLESKLLKKKELGYKNRIPPLIRYTKCEVNVVYNDQTKKYDQENVIELSKCEFFKGDDEERAYNEQFWPKLRNADELKANKIDYY